MFQIGQRVNRIENRETTEATVIEVIEESVHIEYDEGGDGWWPFDTLSVIS